VCALRGSAASRAAPNVDMEMVRDHVWWLPDTGSPDCAALGPWIPRSRESKTFSGAFYALGFPF
jgi:hypothetical protein